MFKRLSVLFLLVAATIGVSPSAHAATLTVNWVDCEIYSYSSYYHGRYRCYASVSGGTGTYVSYTWKLLSSRGNVTIVTTTNTFERNCVVGEDFGVIVTVKDSAGATASEASQRLVCGGPMP